MEEMKLIDCNMTRFSHVLPEGLCDENGVMPVEDIAYDFGKALNYGAHGLRICFAGWEEDERDRFCLPWETDSNKEYRIDRLNQAWKSNVHKICSTLEKFDKYRRPILIVSMFHSSGKYKVWNNNANHVSGFDDPKLFYWDKMKGKYQGLLLPYINYLVKTVKLFDLEWYFEIINECREHNLGLCYRIFDYMLRYLKVPYKKMCFGMQIKAPSQNKKIFVKNKAYKQMNELFDNATWHMFENGMQWSYHKFINTKFTDVATITEGGKFINVSKHTDYHFWFSTDGDNKGKEPNTKYPTEADYIKALEPILKEPYLRSRLLELGIFEAFTYVGPNKGNTNFEACEWVKRLASKYGYKFLNWNKWSRKVVESNIIGKIPEPVKPEPIPEPTPEPITEEVIMKNALDFKGFWQLIKSQGINGWLNLLIHMGFGWLIATLLIWIL